MSPKQQEFILLNPISPPFLSIYKAFKQKKVVKEVLFTVYKLNLPVNNSFLLITLPDFPSLN